jgi:putative ABC transport system substrate-binding protein
MAKRLELLKEVMPQLNQVAVIQNADNPSGGPVLQAMEATAQSLNIKLQPFRLRDPSELVGAFESMEKAHMDAVETGDEPLSTGHAETIAALAARERILSIGPEELPRAGGVLGYGVDHVATYRHTAFFVDKILKGANPANIPIEQASKFAPIVNLKTAKALRIEVPSATLPRADEVIE